MTISAPDETARALRLLLVEDIDDDAALVVRAIRQAGLQVAVVRVQTRDGFLAALTPPPDFIVSDYSLPAFSGVAALACLREAGLDVPFIVVSGTIDEESAVAILRAGAHDFVTKQNLARLGPAIRRELQEAQNRADRRQARGQLQAQRDFLRLVIDANPGAIFAKDVHGRYTLANRAAAEICNTTPDDLVGRTDRDFNRPDAEVAQWTRGDDQVLASGRAVFLEREAVTDLRTGRLRWFETRKVPLIASDGRPQLLGIAIDITERVATEDALRVSEEQFRQAQKMEAVGQLAGGIAHDFNNLLTAILGYSDLLLDRVRQTPDLAQDVEEIRKAGQRASSLTRQLLAFSRKQVLEPRVLNLSHVIADVEKILRRVIGEDVKLRIIAAPSAHPVKVDPGQIEQVVLNLAINARDAMPQGGLLTIEVANATPPPEWADRGSASTQCVSLSVSDTGCGMSPEVRARIFEPFFTTKSPGKGTGLGLAMVYGVVNQTGGYITVESEPHRGTRFVIYLPAATTAASPVVHSVPVLRDLRGSETILLVEDDDGIRVLVRKVLTGYGYQVLDTTDTSHALAVAERHPGPIQLLVSDIVMPGMSGPEVAQRLAPRRPEMQVLYMSGFGTRLSTGLGTMSAAVDLLHKPFTPEALALKVRQCLNRPAPVSRSKGGRGV